MQEYTPIDRALCEAAFLEFNTQVFGSYYVWFQFPPKMTSDSRKGKWEEGELRGYEPVSVFSTSGPREMSLQFTYIVAGGEWTSQRISDNVHRLRGYFAQVRNSAAARNLVVRFRLWKLGGSTPISCRIKSIDVKHSDTIVVPNGDVTKAYPLRTDVTLELALWTQGLPSNRPNNRPGVAATAANAAVANPNQAVANLSGLDPAESPEWY